MYNTKARQERQPVGTRFQRSEIGQILEQTQLLLPFSVLNLPCRASVKQYFCKRKLHIPYFCMEWTTILKLQYWKRETQDHIDRLHKYRWHWVLGLKIYIYTLFFLFLFLNFCSDFFLSEDTAVFPFSLSLTLYFLIISVIYHLLFNKYIYSMVPCVWSVIYHRWRQNVVRTKWHTRCVTYATGWRFLYQFDAVSETPYSCDKVGRGL